MRLFVALSFGVLVGCSPEPKYTEADGKILWDKEGCAYHVRHHIGDTSFITPVVDANKETCK